MGFPSQNSKLASKYVKDEKLSQKYRVDSSFDNNKNKDCCEIRTFVDKIDGFLSHSMPLRISKVNKRKKENKKRKDEKRKSHY